MVSDGSIKFILNMFYLVTGTVTLLLYSEKQIQCDLDYLISKIKGYTVLLCIMISMKKL
ncbi:hypothetical protein BCL69_100373 [Nitrosomonas communis]|uniref:Uncharacterized protein n=1 Tax=Nitrosomonas communis TaxID=44574 RepID=A0A5D3YHL3_9PROT|nr:hypothetical protein BCL69_100373 [Nitrosomonas communis]